MIQGAEHAESASVSPKAADSSFFMPTHSASDSPFFLGFDLPLDRPPVHRALRSSRALRMASSHAHPASLALAFRRRVGQVAERTSAHRHAWDVPHRRSGCAMRGEALPCAKKTSSLSE